jgi:hypothetical protein
MSDPFNERKVVLDDDDGGTSGDKPLYRRHHAFAEHGVHTSHWLIEDHELRPGHPNAGELDEPLLSAAELPGTLIDQIVETKLFQDLARAV